MQAVAVQLEPAEQPVTGGHGQQGEGAQSVDRAVAVGGGARVDTGDQVPHAHRATPWAMAVNAASESVPGAKYPVWPSASSAGTRRAPKSS